MNNLSLQTSESHENSGNIGAGKYFPCVILRTCSQSLVNHESVFFFQDLRVFSLNFLEVKFFFNIDE